MDEQVRIILIIIVSVAIFGLLLFVYVKNYIKSKIDFLTKEKKKKRKTIINLSFLNNHLYLNPLLFLKFQNQNRF